MKRDAKRARKHVQFVFIIPKDIKDAFRTKCHHEEKRMGSKLIELIEAYLIDEHLVIQA